MLIGAEQDYRWLLFEQRFDLPHLKKQKNRIFQKALNRGFETNCVLINQLNSLQTNQPNQLINQSISQSNQSINQAISQTTKQLAQQ